MGWKWGYHYVSRCWTGVYLFDAETSLQPTWLEGRHLYALKFRFNYQRQYPCTNTLQYMGPDGRIRSNKNVTEDFYLDLLSKSQISQNLGQRGKSYGKIKCPDFPL